jgi:L-ascorbate metabolism protein UlaG (beta-lactamase superfamily)
MLVDCSSPPQRSGPQYGCSVSSPTSRRPEPGGDAAKVTFVGHATVLLEAGGHRVLTDPVLTDRVAFTRRVVEPVKASSWADIGIVLLSHLHHDHLHLPSLSRLAPDTTIVAPRGARPLLRRHDVLEVEPGDRFHFGSLAVSVVPADHDPRRTPWGPRARPVGYVVELDGWSCWFAGDTGPFAEMAELSDRIDLALLPIWGWGPNLGHGHLDPAGAAAVVDLVRPRAVLPIHWGTLWPVGLHRYRRDRLVLPPLELADSLQRLGVRADLHAVPPGGTITAARESWAT